MDKNYWHQRWGANRIAFHNLEAHPLLIKHFKDISKQKPGRVFVPLCGKTLDITWLLTNGHQVAGVELSELAIEQLFAGLGIEPTITEVDGFKHYSATNIDIFSGDFFDLTSNILGPIDAIFDRAALVALPEEIRAQYAKHIASITNAAPQLLITFEYDQSLANGPPFSVSSAEVHQHYAKCYDIRALAEVDVVGGVKGTAATESVWLLE